MAEISTAHQAQTCLATQNKRINRAKNRFSVLLITLRTLTHQFYNNSTPPNPLTNQNLTDFLLRCFSNRFQVKSDGALIIRLESRDGKQHADWLTRMQVKSRLRDWMAMVHL